MRTTKQTLSLLVVIALMLSLCPLIITPAHAQQTEAWVNCGGVNDTASFQAAITGAAGNPRTIRIPYKSDSTKRCALNTITIPSNITLDNTDGSGINKNAGQIITVLGPLVNPVGKAIFFGPGTVSFAGNAFTGASGQARITNGTGIESYGSSGGGGENVTNATDAPCNADNTGATSARNALVCAYFAALATGSKKIYMPAGTYLITVADIALTGHQLYIIDADIEWFGDGMGKTVIKLEAGATPGNDPTVMFISGHRANVHDFTILGSSNVLGDQSMVGVGLRNSKDSWIHRVEVVNLNNNIAAGGGAAGAIAFDYTSSGAVSYEELSTTTLGTAIAAGTRTVAPASMVNIATGRRLKVGGTTEYVVITSMTHTTFTAVFANAHGSSDVVTALGEGQDRATFEENIVRDCFDCSAFVVNAQGGRFFKNRMINGGNAGGGTHAFYVQQGGNVFDSNYIEYFGIPAIQDYPGGTGARDMTANRYINNDVIGTRHFFTSGSAQINDAGVIKSVPVNYSLSRQQIIIGNHFRTPWKAGIVGAIEVGPQVIFADNYCENSFVQQVPLGLDAVITGNGFTGIQATYNWGVLVRDHATVANNKFIDINTSSSIGTEAPISAGSYSDVHDNQIIGGNYLYAISASGGTATKIHDNTITGAVAGAIASPKAILMRATTGFEIYNNYIDGNSVISILDNFADGGAAPGSIKFHGNVIKNFALDSGRIIRHDNVTTWGAGLDFYDNDIPQLAAVERNSGKMWSGGRNVSVDVNQNELVGIDSNNRFTDITTGSTRFFGVYAGPQASIGVANDDIMQFAIYEVGAECSLKTDGTWVRGNVGIISTSAARKIHDTGVATAPATFDISYVVFLDSGTGAGTAKVRIVKAL